MKLGFREKAENLGFKVWCGGGFAIWFKCESDVKLVHSLFDLFVCVWWGRQFDLFCGFAWRQFCCMVSV
jgi:hypothetical protein